jgi:hypothetical protein
VSIAPSGGSIIDVGPGLRSANRFPHRARIITSPAHRTRSPFANRTGFFVQYTAPCIRYDTYTSFGSSSFTSFASFGSNPS